MEFGSCVCILIQVQIFKDEEMLIIFNVVSYEKVEFFFFSMISKCSN